MESENIPAEVPVGRQSNAGPQWLGWVALLSGLLVMLGVGIAARWARFQADDFCFAGWVRTKSPWDYQWTSYNQFSGRFALNFFHITVIPLGDAVPFVLPVVLTVGLILSVGLAIHASTTWALGRSDRGWSGLASIAVCAALVVALPDRVSALLWPTVIVGYGLPTVFLLLLVAAVIRPNVGGVTSGVTRAALWALLGVAAAVAAGFQETSAALQFVVFATVLQLTRSSEDDRVVGVRTKALAVVVGTVVGVAIDVLAPGNSNRLAITEADRSVALVIGRAIRGGASFMIHSVTEGFVPLLVVVVVGLSLGGLIKPERPWSRRPFLALAVLGGWTSVTLVLMAVPNVYGKGKFPSAYAYFPFWTVMACASLAAGVVVGEGLRSTSATWAQGLRRWVVPFASIAVLVMCAFLVVSMADQAQGLRLDARRWDSADRSARVQVQNGNRTVEVPYGMASTMGEVTRDRRNWVNRCYADFVGAQDAVLVPGR